MIRLCALTFMNRVSTLLAGMSAVALFTAPGAWAQESGQDTGSRIPDPIQLPTGTPSPSPAPSGSIVAIPPAGQNGGQSGAIGPDSLSGFSLDGSTPAPRPAQRPTPAPTPAPQPATAPTRSSPSAAPPPVRTNSPVTRPSQPPVGPEGSFGRLTPVPPTSIGREAFPEEPGSPLDLPVPDGLTNPESGMANWPWLLALLAVIGGGIFAWQLRRQRTASAGGPAIDALQAAPEASPPPSPPQPETPKPSVPSGIVTTSALKPDLKIEVVPTRAVFSQDGFSLDYQLTIANIGHGAAQRPTIRQDWLFASATQAEDYEAFLARPADSADQPLPQSIPPGSAIRLDAKAHLPLEKAQAVVIDGRQLLLPIIALRIRHGGQAPAQKPAAHGMWLIGRKGGSDGRMAPIRADMGARIIRDVELKRQ